MHLGEGTAQDQDSAVLWVKGPTLAEPVDHTEALLHLDPSVLEDRVNRPG